MNMALKRELKKLEFTFSRSQMLEFIDKLVDLSAIDDYIVCKIDESKFLLYGVATDVEDKAHKNILAFKCFSFNTKSIISPKADIAEQVVFIIKDTKKTIRSIKNYLDFDESITCTISYDALNDINIGDMLKMKNSKLKLNFNGGSPRDTNIKITMKAIIDKSTPDMLEFKFNINKEDFDKSKKMSLIETENDIIYFTVQDGELSVSENRWSLKLQDIVYKNQHGVESDINISIPKKYYKNATCDENGLAVEVYKTHIIINNEKSTLMVSRQMTIN